ncbi:biotin synthase BioB [Uliginosibacterium aquaticum]|uniref:Biotin synthase n=1 Tax=Uliginosibacterium aquaticum TaxID=2731212 RepID=A0ABX2IHK3_9RHOO|nr:biotin synthase BioB [Uliginosibacterium aquaticum]NSL54492.1 biotin synthase BioB [Uliginosibacterium aquaticum]
MNSCSPAEHKISFHRSAEVREGEWSTDAVAELFELPFADLIFRAQEVHRKHFDANAVQRSTLLSIKTGGCSEDCSYCSQSKRYKTGLEAEPLMSLEEVLKMAQAAKDKGASRFCMGAAWRSPKEKDLEPVLEMVSEVKKLGLETCVTLGMLKDGQAERLKAAGLDYYNHNLDTAREFYSEIVTTHTIDDRLDTIDKVRSQGIKVCAGGIVGLGENRRARAVLIAQLANLNPAPESVPINGLVPIAGTPLAEVPALDPIEFVRTIAVARITMPTSYVRLSAGRQQMSDETQALCYLAGANSIFSGDRLLTTDNPDADRDAGLFARLGIQAV